MLLVAVVSANHLVAFNTVAAEATAALDEEVSTTEEEHHEEEAVEAVYAVLMPWFVQAVGVVAFYLLSRKLHGVPYTLVMFVAGMLMGIGVALSDVNDQLTESILIWRSINAEVLFAVFLPGLLFKDAFEINFHLFFHSFWQLMILAFPMVLGGTMLTACVGLYIFPYGWSFSLCLVFGAIMAATDPVAVSALLNEVGAPPRLKIHIAGESLLNDGSAVVFFTVFVEMFFNETFQIGRDVTVGHGVVIFLRMALGGAAVGIAFALALVFLLYKLDRRLEKEETVVQVVSTVTVAYLSFYTAQIPCRMSGVIAVVVCGIVTRAFGGGLISDQGVMNSFWTLLEHLLNTLLFTLAGVEFGYIIADTEQEWTGQDWGYLILLYLLVNVIRFVLLGAFYPLLSRIGTKTNKEETLFAAWSGLRGAVGITLALGLDSEVRELTTDPETLILSYKLFGMVAGVAFLTLLINGPVSGLLLLKLGLADSSEARLRIVKAAEEAARRQLLDDFIHLMIDPRFYFVDFSLVVHHCPMLKDITAEELGDAVDNNRESVHPNQYQIPNLDHVLPYIPNSENLKRMLELTKRDMFLGGGAFANNKVDLEDLPEEDADATEAPAENSAALLKDMRVMFVQLLKASYNAQIRDGELDPREYEGFLSYSLLQSLEFAHERATKGNALNDWTLSQIVRTIQLDQTEHFGKLIGVRLYAWLRFKKQSEPHQHLSYQHLRLEVLRAFSFIDAHLEAQEHLVKEFGKNEGELKLAVQQVLRESKEEVAKARSVLRSKTKKQLRDVISHHLCTILLNKAARYITRLTDSGILLPREATEELEKIEHNMLEVRSCPLSLEDHPGRIHVVEEEEQVLTNRRSGRTRQSSLL